jgi:hypothetical protein
MAQETATKPGPAIGDTIEEVRGRFPSQATLDEAVARLRQEGFDHADLSLPEPVPAAGEATPERGAAPVTTETDARQMRTLHGGMAGAAGAMAAAGAVVLTGGALAPAAAAAVAAGLGAGAAAEVAENSLGAAADRKDQDRAAAEGRLILAARVTSPELRSKAERAMRAAGASEVAAVRRTDAVDSTRWTG